MTRIFVVFVLCLDLFHTLSAQTSVCKEIISKKRWGAKAGKGFEYSIIPVPNIIIHHTVTPQCMTEEDCSERILNIQSYHMDRLNFFDIGYNFVVGGDGKVYEGLGWHKVGAHTFGWNRKSIGVAFIGNYNSDVPSQGQLEALKKLIKCGVETGEIDGNHQLFGGKSVIATESPGQNLLSAIQDWKGFTRRPL